MRVPALAGAITVLVIFCTLVVPFTDSGTSPSFTWKGDFDYSSLEEMQSAGWILELPIIIYGFGSGTHAS